MLSALKNRAAEHLQNAPGWRTNERIVVIESDDWGAVRTKDQETLKALEAVVSPATINRFNTKDCLEKRQDLEALAEVLAEFRDACGRSPVITANTVLGNPEFDAIGRSGFESFIGETFFESYQRYYGDDLQGLWRELMESGVWKPQFHADYHVDVERWMQDLRTAQPGAREAANLNFFGQLGKSGNPNKNHYLATFHAETPSDLEAKLSRWLDGLKQFEKTFGFSSTTFIPPNYVWNDALEPVLMDSEVIGQQGNRVQFIPDIQDSGAIKKSRRYFQYTEKSHKPVQLVRNVQFEPYCADSPDIVRAALKQVATAFLWRKPAIIGTHRINYVGHLDIHHRDRSLSLLAGLIKAIISRWPDVCFLSSEEVAWMIKHEKEN